MLGLKTRIFRLDDLAHAHASGCHGAHSILVAVVPARVARRLRQ